MSGNRNKVNKDIFIPWYHKHGRTEMQRSKTNRIPEERTYERSKIILINEVRTALLQVTYN